MNCSLWSSCRTRPLCHYLQRDTEHANEFRRVPQLNADGTLLPRCRGSPHMSCIPRWFIGGTAAKAPVAARLTVATTPSTIPCVLDRRTSGSQGPENARLAHAQGLTVCRCANRIRTHNPEVTGSNPVPATLRRPLGRLSCVLGIKLGLELITAGS